MWMETESKLIGQLEASCSDLLDIVEFEYDADPERVDLVSWRRAMSKARKAIIKAQNYMGGKK
jgi:hypothetical protein